MPTIPICTYCNSLATTIDHVPPSLIFPKPRPANLITVPACYDCNNSASLDDEYFRLVTALEEKSGEHPDSIELLPVIIRSLNRRQAQGFRKTFARSQFDCDIFTESGLFLKSAIGYNVDKDRLNAVFERITRGLFLNTFGRRLPLETRVSASQGRGLVNPSIVEFVKKILEEGSSWNCLGNGTFCWKYSTCLNQPETTAWIFVVFSSIVFISTTIGEDPAR
jgi:hypothetical protein